MQQILLDGLVTAKIREIGTTRQNLADSMGIKTVATLNAKVTGNSELSLKEAFVLSRFLGTTIDEIHELTNNQN